MKILVLSNLWPPYYIGGYELAAANVTKALRERGHEVMVGTTPSHIPAPPDPDYVRRSMKATWFSPFPRRDGETERQGVIASATGEYEHAIALLDMLKTFEPDVVYCWNVFAMGGLSVFDVLETVGVPRVVHLMDKLPEFIFSNMPPALRPIYGGALGGVLRSTSAIAMSEHLVDEIANDTGITFDGPIAIVPGWVDTEKLSHRTRYLEGGVARFVTAGAVAPHKGIGLIIEAAAKLVAERHHAFTIDIYGEGEISTFIEMANVYGVSDRVRFMGGRKQSELLELYAGYDAFLFPTWEREPFGFAPIEAAACGCVPIMTRNCGASERLLGDVHCIKIERDADQLKDAMLRVLDGKVDLVSMGRAATQMIRQDLGFKKCLDEIETVLDNAAAQGWDPEKARDQKLPLLFYAKHHLAQGLAYGYPI